MSRDGSRTLRASGLALALVAAWSGLEAQDRSAPTTPIRTLSTWAHDAWLGLLDRDGGWFGRVAEQGIFQRFNPLMDDEYELDIWTGLFSPAEDARWAAAPGGVRAGGTSISHPHTLNLVDWRYDATIAGPVDFLADYARRGSLTEQRDYVAVGTRWRGALGSGSAVRLGIGVHFFKPSGDVELGLERAWSPGPREAWHLDFRFAFLDAFSNVVFNLLDVSAEEAEAHFDYQTGRYAARLALTRTGGPLRAEIHAGATNRTRADVTFPAAGDPGFRLAERVAFAGALAELRVSHRVAVAGYATVAHAATDRDGSQGETLLRRQRETTRSLGGTAWLTLVPEQALGLEADVRTVWRHEDRAGDGPPRHDDREVLLHLGLARRPPVEGWQWRVTLSRMDREAGPLAPQLTAVNDRSLMEAGYRFRSGFEIMGGLRWDLDGSGTFDGGHLRVMHVK